MCINEKCTSPCWVPKDPITDINASMAFFCRASLGWLFQVVMLHGAVNVSGNPSLAVYVGGCLKPRNFLALWLILFSVTIISLCLCRFITCSWSPDRPMCTQHSHSPSFCLQQRLSELSESMSATSPPTLPRSSGDPSCPVWRATMRSASVRFQREERKVVE